MPGSWGQNLQNNLNIDKQKLFIILYIYYILTGIDHVLDMGSEPG